MFILVGAICSSMVNDIYIYKLKGVSFNHLIKSNMKCSFARYDHQCRGQLFLFEYCAICAAVVKY